tara:strand:- start:57 stop:293 length:237 start_codon:yes stop_codon:yes gene_type:complete
MNDIKSMIESMSVEDIKSLMANIDSRNIRSVDTSRRERRLAKNELYFSVAPLPYKSTFEEYKLESEAIRQQVLSGVDL